MLRRVGVATTLRLRGGRAGLLSFFGDGCHFWPPPSRFSFLRGLGDLSLLRGLEDRSLLRGLGDLSLLPGLGGVLSPAPPRDSRPLLLLDIGGDIVAEDSNL